MRDVLEPSRAKEKFFEDSLVVEARCCWFRWSLAQGPQFAARRLVEKAFRRWFLSVYRNRKRQPIEPSLPCRCLIDFVIF